MSAYAEYHASAHKLLSDNRAVYIAMSELHKNGKRPTYSEAEQYALDQMRDHPTNFAGSYGDLAHGV